MTEDFPGFLIQFCNNVHDILFFSSVPVHDEKTSEMWTLFFLFTFVLVNDGSSYYLCTFSFQINKYRMKNVCISSSGALSEEFVMMENFLFRSVMMEDILHIRNYVVHHQLVCEETLKRSRSFTEKHAWQMQTLDLFARGGADVKPVQDRSQQTARPGQT